MHTLSYSMRRLYILLLHAEPIHRSADKALLVERATHLEHIALNLHRAVVGLTIVRVIDTAAGVLTTNLLEAAEHVEPHDTARAKLAIGIVHIHYGRAIGKGGILQPHDLAIVCIALTIHLYDGCAIIEFPLAYYILCHHSAKGRKHKHHTDK